MKTKIDRMKNRAKSMSKRSLALMLSILVLITAVGAGAVFTAIAATTNSVSDGQSASERIEATANRYDTEETMLNGAPDAAAAENDTNADAGAADAVTLSKKGGTDLAGTGATYAFQGSFPGMGGWDSSYTGVSLNTAYSFTVSSTGTYYFRVLDGSTRFGASAGTTITGSQDYNLNSSHSSDTDTLGVVANVTGTYKITMKSSPNNGSVTVHVDYPSATSYTISYNTPTNGSFTTKPTSANSGSTVTFVATPANGYEIDTVTVKNGSTNITTTKKRQHI
ncbi:MAG: hypothetical protein IJV48_05285 [Ruminococcus sp.]|nr:hypothetical protein [Ruminococcus sp.]